MPASEDNIDDTGVPVYVSETHALIVLENVRMDYALSPKQKKMILEWAQQIWNLPEGYQGVLKRNGERLRVETHVKERADSAQGTRDKTAD